MSLGTSRYRRPAPAALDQRQIDRHPVFIQRATVRRHKAQAVEARLQDISIYGCRIEGAGVAKDGERIWIRIQGGMPIGATVMWTEGELVGCRFDAPISSGTVRALSLGI